VAKNTFLVTTTKISLVHVLSPLEQALPYNPEDLCSLKWKLRKLLVKHELFQPNNLAALENFQWLINCLNHSATQAVCVDLDLGNEALHLWADACQKSKKKIFVRVPSSFKLPKKLYPLKWIFKRIADFFIAILLIISFSPIILVLALLIRLTSSEPVFSREWKIGYRGKLFQLIKFQTVSNDLDHQTHQVSQFPLNSKKILDNPTRTRLGYWMHKYGLDSLPQLINVLRGEMSFVGPMPIDLCNAIHVDPKSRSCLRFLPGITGIYQSERFLEEEFSDKNFDFYLIFTYLSNWSLIKDTRILLTTILSIFSISKLN
jgi:lipopolysaccharide/colanic/teichoic acid biosynthesis glycosyltransferase